MDIATVLGLLLAWGMMAAAVYLGGGSFGAFWNTASILMVVGGTIGALLICFPLRTIRRTPRVMLKGMRGNVPKPEELIATIVSLAETARREGLLSLELRLHLIPNDFIRRGIELVVDGARAEVIEEVLRTDIDAMAARHREGKAVFEQLGKYAPAFGMIGTLLGLIIMLGNMSDPSSIGAGMAVALITTLYGAVLANASFLPMAEKLAYLSKQEMLSREIIIRGVLAIQSGENPRLIERKLSTFLPPAARSKREVRLAA
jgi:chemotaxis protein MotA